MFTQPYWRAEVYSESNDQHGIIKTEKLFAGIYASRHSAEEAAKRKCKRVRGFGFYVHLLGANRP